MPDDPRNLSVALVVTDDLRNRLSREAGALDEVRTYSIDDGETAQMVATEMNDIKRRVNNLAAEKEKFTSPAKQVLDAANNLFNGPIERLKEAEGFCKRLLAGWDDRERTRIAQERQAREAEERKIRQDAEAKAAAERAKADEIARQKRAEADEAERKAKEARDAGDKRAAAAAEARAASLNQQAQGALETGAANAQQIELHAAVSTQAMPAVAAQAVDGATFRDKWTARLQSGITDEAAKRMIIAQCAKDLAASPAGVSPLLACLMLDMVTIRRLATGLKTSMNVPGFEAFNDRQVAGKNK